MQKQLCFSLGIALFCVAAVLYFNTNSGNNFDLRTVSETEARSVNGGGETNTLPEDAVNGREIIQNLPKEIEDVLKKNAEKLNKVSLIFRRTRTTQLPAEQLLKQIHCLYEYGFFEPSDHKFIWQSPCFYQYSSGLFSVKSETGSDKVPFAYELPFPNLSC
jgi:hypothetical protein